MQMKNIEECLSFLDEQFESHDVRMVPSVLLGGGHCYRVTVSNLRRWNYWPVYSYADISYLAAFQQVIIMIKEGIANE